MAVNDTTLSIIMADVLVRFPVAFRCDLTPFSKTVVLTASNSHTFIVKFALLLVETLYNYNCFKLQAARFKFIGC